MESLKSPARSIKKGVYDPYPTDYSKFEIKVFRPNLFDPALYSLCGCAYSAMSLLSGEDPFDLRKKNNDENSVEEDYVLKYLKEKGFEYEELTLCSQSNPVLENRVMKNSIHPYYLLLILQLWGKNTASYQILWNGLLFHNFQPRPLDNLEFLNRPILNCYILQHENYKS